MACNNPECKCGPECQCQSGSRLSCICSRQAAMVERVALRYLEASEPKLPDFWLTRDDIQSVCPPCAARMASLRIRRVLASAIFGQDMLNMAAEQIADKWKGMPKGWDSGSRKKLWNSLGGSVKDCMSSMSGKVDNPGAFCASLKDRVEKSPSWRGPED